MVRIESRRGERGLQPVYSGSVTSLGVQSKLCYQGDQAVIFSTPEF